MAIKELSLLQQLLETNRLNISTFDKYDYAAQIYGLQAFLYYNISVLWGNIPIIRDYSLGEVKANQISQSDVFQYSYELLNKIQSNVPIRSTTTVTTSLFSNAKALKTEIALYMGDLDNIQATTINDRNCLFTILSTDGTELPIYTISSLKLLIEEAKRQKNSNKWFEQGVSYGVWAALKRQGAAETLTKCKHHELLMPIPQIVINTDSNIKQNTGY